jgi:hypothetical protein
MEMLHYISDLQKKIKDFSMSEEYYEYLVRELKNMKNDFWIISSKLFALALLY